MSLPTLIQMPTQASGGGVSPVVHHWTLDGTSAGLVDQKGLMDLQNIGGVAAATGPSGEGAAVVTRASQYYRVPADPTAQGDSYTITLWIYLTDLTANAVRFFGDYDNSGNAPSSVISGLFASSQVGSIGLWGGTNAQALKVGYPAASTWLMVAHRVDADAGTVSYYQGGVITPGNRTLTHRPLSRLHFGTIGPQTISTGINGRIAHARISAGVLSLSELDSMAADPTYEPGA